MSWRGLPSHTAASLARDDAHTLTIMTNTQLWAGFTPASLAGVQSEATFYRYYHTLWAKQFPGLTIKEIDTKDMNELTTKVILEVNAGNPPDLIGTDIFLGTLVARKAVENLDSYYQGAHITASTFLPSMVDYVRMQGHWYAMPGASNPSIADLLYLPALVKAAGWDPTNIPRTWDELWTATQKVTKWDSKGNLVRIGVPVYGGGWTDLIDLYCGRFTTYDPKTVKFHANSPCIKDYFRYEKRLLDFYGGLTKYTNFISGDPWISGCSPKAYIPTGKIIFAIDAYWGGIQLDACYPAQWALSWAPTPHGTVAEQRGMRVPAWEVMIPTGAKHPQLAFDFTKFTLWDHGDMMGPTTNGYTVADQAASWAQSIVVVEGQTRASHHYAGNPMADAMKVVVAESQHGLATRPTDVAAPYYFDQMAFAWDQVRYGRATVDQALDQAQRLVDAKQRALHAQSGM
jgi:ABC-type glycerol-3-phosphate transport system substrate-binding protein